MFYQQLAVKSILGSGYNHAWLFVYIYVVYYTDV